MDFIVTFFRDILDGPIYIVVAVICGILVCSCIGYLAEQSQLKKENKEKHDNEYAKVSNNTPTSTPSVVNTINSVTSTTGPTQNFAANQPNLNNNVQQNNTKV